MRIQNAERGRLVVVENNTKIWGYDSASKERYLLATFNIGKPNEIKKVIYHDPATIVFWQDGTKTVVKCVQGEEYDPEKGILYCIAKRFLGNSFHRQLRTYCWDTDEMSNHKKEKRDLHDLQRMLP